MQRKKNSADSFRVPSLIIKFVSKSAHVLLCDYKWVEYN